MRALRTLVVEDDAMIGGLLAETLEGLGHSVCAVESNVANAVHCRDAQSQDDGDGIGDVWRNDAGTRGIEIGFCEVGRERGGGGAEERE